MGSKKTLETNIRKTKSGKYEVTYYYPAYDSEGNATSKTYANGQALRYEYDTNGNITDVYDATSATEEKIYHYEHVKITDDTGKETWVKSSVTDYRQNRITRNTYGSTGKLYMVSVYAIDNDDESLLYSYTTGVNGNTVSFGGHTITTDASYSDIFGDSDDPIGQEGVSTIKQHYRRAR